MTFLSTSCPYPAASATAITLFSFDILFEIMLISTIAVCLVFLASLVYQRQCRRRSSQDRVRKWLQQERAVVDFTFAGDTVLKDRLQLRGRANQRLVSAFGILNSLTTSSVKLHNEFRRTASRALGNNNARWQRLYSVAEKLLRHEIHDATQCEGGSLALANCTRYLCLTVILVDVFGADPASLPREPVVSIGEEINNQWLQSKYDPKVPRSERLNSALRGLGLTRTSADWAGAVNVTTEEALGLIIPQYETLWRVVLLTFVTAYYRQPRSEVSKRVEEVPSCLGDSGREKEALKLAKASLAVSFGFLWSLLSNSDYQEGLRLYPSNKRIYRAASKEDSEKELVSADVEACHRNRDIWGPDVLQFRPERFDNLTGLQREAYFPYSLGTHRCPAFAGFGDRMVTMLVVSLGRMLSSDVGLIRYNCRVLDKDPGEPLPTGRDDMKDWAFVI